MNTKIKYPIVINGGIYSNKEIPRIHQAIIKDGYFAGKSLQECKKMKIKGGVFLEDSLYSLQDSIIKEGKFTDSSLKYSKKLIIEGGTFLGNSLYMIQGSIINGGTFGHNATQNDRGVDIKRGCFGEYCLSKFYNSIINGGTFEIMNLKAIEKIKINGGVFKQDNIQGGNDIEIRGGNFGYRNLDSCKNVYALNPTGSFRKIHRPTSGIIVAKELTIAQRSCSTTGTPRSFTLSKVKDKYTEQLRPGDLEIAENFILSENRLKEGLEAFVRFYDSRKIAKR